MLTVKVSPFGKVPGIENVSIAVSGVKVGVGHTLDLLSLPEDIMASIADVDVGVGLLANTG